MVKNSFKILSILIAVGLVASVGWVAAGVNEIVVQKTASPDSVPAEGGDVTYTVTVTNQTGQTVALESIEDDTFDISVECNTSEAFAADIVTTLAPGESYECEFTRFVVGTPGSTHTNTVTATASGLDPTCDCCEGNEGDGGGDDGGDDGGDGGGETCDCCTAQGVPGCASDAACEEAVCAVDAFCCNTEWDQICADEAVTLCDCCDAGDGGGETCGCCQAQGEPGSDGLPGCASDGQCEAIVCALDEFCCDTFWDLLCADTAVDECDCCNQLIDNACCFPNTLQDPSGCQGDDLTCEEAVCDVDAYCCDVAWDAVCAEEAALCCETCGGGASTCQAVNTTPASTESRVAGGTARTGRVSQSYAGDPSGVPGCNDVSCEELVCAADSFCCSVNWDNICANEAVALCDCCSPAYMGSDDEEVFIEDEELLVILESFTAQVDMAGRVRLRWTTLAEIDTVGFRILRAIEGQEPVRISRTIPSEGDELSGASYGFRDGAPIPAGPVTYFLMEVDFAGYSAVVGTAEVEVSGKTIGGVGIGKLDGGRSGVKETGRGVREVQGTAPRNQSLSGGR